MMQWNLSQLRHDSSLAKQDECDLYFEKYFSDDGFDTFI